MLGDYRYFGGNKFRRIGWTWHKESALQVREEQKARGRNVRVIKYPPVDYKYLVYVGGE